MRLLRFWRRARRDDELGDELEAYVAQETAERMRDGLSAEDARFAALRKLGNTTRIRENVYEAGSLGWIEHLAKDVRYAARVLRRSPGFAIAAVASLILGIGANTAIFELLNAVRLRSLPVARPSELVEIAIVGGNRGMGINSGPHSILTAPLFEALHREQQAFGGLFAWSTYDYMREGRGIARPTVRALIASGDLFPTLEVKASRGRLLVPADDRHGCGAGPIVVSQDYWLRRFAGRDDAVGSSLVLDDKTFQIVGVTPPEFFGLEVGKQFDVALPLCAQAVWDPDVLDQKNRWWLSGMGRLKPGWTLERASEHLASLSTGLFSETVPSDYEEPTLKRWRSLVLTALPGSHGISQWRDDYEASLWLLLGITGLVLLMACANLASLMLARASVREREFALRTAIGASRGRIVSQALAESILIALVGATGGAWLASALSQSLIAFVSTDAQPLILDAGMDWRVLVFTGAVASITCLACGLVPALRSASIDPANALKAGGRSLTAAAGFSFQRLLVIFQVAVSLVLVVGALLFVRSFRNLTMVDTGMRLEHLNMAVAGFSRPGMTPQESQRIRATLLEQVQALPEVHAAATSTLLPLSGMSWTHTVKVPSPKGEQQGDSKFTWVSPSYFQTMQVPLVEGRLLNDHDTVSSTQVIVVNETFVRRYLNRATAVGTRVRTVAEPEYPSAEREIVGIVRDTKYGSLREETPPSAFAPASQHPAPQPFTFLAIRSTASIATLRQQLGRVYTRAGATSDVAVWPIVDQVRDSLLRDRLMSWLSGFFGVLAGLLSAVGLYGVMAFAAARRSNEIAIRMALGASRSDVVQLMLGQASRLLAIGIVLGTVAAIAAGRTVAALLFGIGSHDAATFVAAAVLLAAIGLAAAYVPTARAARISPLDGLRAE
jgi:putative ABC transport system permease protein